MSAIEIILLCIVVFASNYYISKIWKNAVKKRDADWISRPSAGVYKDEHKKPSALRYLFKWYQLNQLHRKAFDIIIDRDVALRCRLFR